MKLLAPQLEAPLSATLRDVVPFYVEMGRNRFEDFGPKLDARVKQQADGLGADLERKLGAQLDAFFERLGSNVSAQMTQAFPAMTADGGAHATAKIQQVMTDQEARLRENAQTLYQAEARRIGEALQRFPASDVSQVDLDTLHRQLLHELLMFADYEMTGPAAPATLAAPATAVPPMAGR
jgi:hypothetical protein